VRRRRLVVLPAAELDVAGHIAYLEAQRPGLGKEGFADAFLERVAVLRGDALWPVVEKKRGVRLLPMDRPWEKYGIFFTVTDDQAVVRAVLHLVRNVRRHLRDR
jgi:hypothetical protein